jgi:hypothetical protein
MVWEVNHGEWRKQSSAIKFEVWHQERNGDLDATYQSIKTETSLAVSGAYSSFEDTEKCTLS